MLALTLPSLQVFVHFAREQSDEDPGEVMDAGQDVTLAVSSPGMRLSQFLEDNSYQESSV